MKDEFCFKTHDVDREVDMTHQLKHIGNFDHVCDDIGVYLEKLEQYFRLNGIEDQAKQTAIFLTVIGKKTYGLLRKLFAPDLPTSQTIAVLIEKLKSYLGPKSNMVAERYRFYCRNQKDNETVEKYVSELRKLTSNCDFGAFLNDVMRDKFICGLKDLNMRDHLLTHNNTLTLDDAVDIAKQFERRTKLKRETTHQENGMDVVVLPGLEGRKCNRCNSKYHVSQACRFKEVVCHKCNVMGHLGTACVGKNVNDGELGETCVGKNVSGGELSTTCVGKNVSGGGLVEEKNMLEQRNTNAPPFAKVHSETVLTSYDERHGGTRHNETATVPSFSRLDANHIDDERGTRQRNTTDTRALKCNSCRNKEMRRQEMMSNIAHDNKARTTSGVDDSSSTQNSESRKCDVQLHSSCSDGTCASELPMDAEHLKHQAENEELRTDDDTIGKDGIHGQYQQNENEAYRKTYDTERVRHLFNLMYNSRGNIGETNSTEDIGDSSVSSKEPGTLTDIMRTSLRSNYALKRYLGTLNGFEEPSLSSDTAKQYKHAGNAHDKELLKELWSDHACDSCSYCKDSLEKGIRFLTDTSRSSDTDKDGTSEENFNAENRGSHTNDKCERKNKRNKYRLNFLSVSDRLWSQQNDSESSTVLLEGGLRNSKTKTTTNDSVGHIINDDDIHDNDVDDDVQYVTTQDRTEALEVTVTVDSQHIKFNINTGSPVSIISEVTYRKYFSTNNLSPTNVVLKTYDDERIPVVGKLNVRVEHYGKVYPVLKLYVVSGYDVNMLGRDWLNEIKLDWSALFSECMDGIKDKQQHQVN